MKVEIKVDGYATYKKDLEKKEVKKETEEKEEKLNGK